MPDFKKPSGDFNSNVPAHVTAFFAAVMANDLPEVTRVLDARPDAPHWKDRVGNTPLMMAVIFGATHKNVIDLLIGRGADVNAQNAHGGNALARAAHFGHGELVKQLLALGADVHMKDAAGQDAVDWANKNGHADIAALLLGRKNPPVRPIEKPPQP